LELGERNLPVTFMKTSRPAPSRNQRRAFGRIDSLMVCAALGLIALAAAPALSLNRSESERMICFNNLRLIGGAAQTWAGDHNRQFPWRTYTDEGGLLPWSGTRAGNAWFDYWFLSNELVTPKILACPSDYSTLTSSDWETFGSAFYRANAVSYPISLEGSGDAPRAWLSADRNFTAGGSGFCSARVNNINAVPLSGAVATTAWTNGVVHGLSGHVLTVDGTVEYTSTPRLREIMAHPSTYDSGSAHFLKAR
jgi:hypothetical protein